MCLKLSTVNRYLCKLGNMGAFLDKPKTEKHNAHGAGNGLRYGLSKPEVYEIVRAEEDEFIVLACDGIWDVMSNEELCEFVKSRLEVSDDLEKVCNWVVDTCLHKGSRDNMSIVLVCFSNAPKVSDEAMKRDADLDKHLESRVEEIMEKSGEEGMPDLAQVMRILSAENIPNLPPGGGLAGKRNIIEAVYNRLNPHRENEGGAGDLEDPW
ncbi:Protein-serine/threonine phosphatase [Crotalus adamanteus]|uniref:Protein-serine/threonine phosphatase n=1 Tax=Crotalus adamanteus TaxID=8729 RepID=A0AAW1CD63_CROAD